MLWLRERLPFATALLLAEPLMLWGTEGNVAAWLCLNVLAVLSAYELRRSRRVQRWLTGRDA